MKELRDKKSLQDSSSIAVGDCIEFDDVTIRTPKDITLVEHLSFKLEREQSLLLTGHNGAGKSSIFRCLGGTNAFSSACTHTHTVPSETRAQDTYDDYLPILRALVWYPERSLMLTTSLYT